MGRGCGSAGRAVASDPRDPLFESSYQQIFFTPNNNSIVKTKLKEKEARNCPIKHFIGRNLMDFSIFRPATKYNILHCNYRLPEGLGDSAKSLIRCLLQNRISDRLGGHPADADKVKGHVFFNGFDWAAAFACTNAPPFIPR